MLFAGFGIVNICFSFSMSSQRVSAVPVGQFCSCIAGSLPVAGLALLVPSFWQAEVRCSMLVKFQQLHYHSLKFLGQSGAQSIPCNSAACNKSIGSDCLRQPAMQALGAAKPHSSQNQLLCNDLKL